MKKLYKILIYVFVAFLSMGVGAVIGNFVEIPGFGSAETSKILGAFTSNSADTSKPETASVVRDALLKVVYQPTTQTPAASDKKN